MVLPAHQHAAGELCSDGQYETVGAENPATSPDLQILVYEAAEAISSQRPDGRSGGRGSAAYGRMLGECSVRSVGVVVLEVLLQHRREMARSDDQKWSRHSRRRVPIAFDDGVRSRRSNRGADDLDVCTGEHRVESGGELAVAIADHEPELVGVVAEVHQQVAGLLGDPGSGGVSGDPGNVNPAGTVGDHYEQIEAAEEDGVDVGEVDREDRVRMRRQERSPRGAGP